LGRAILKSTGFGRAGRGEGWAAGWRGRRVGRGEVRRLRYGEDGARIANKKEVGKFHPCAVLPLMYVLYFYNFLFYWLYGGKFCRYSYM
jgi:hypothetical protein